jgi:hypothetical protein
MSSTSFGRSLSSAQRQRKEKEHYDTGLEDHGCD